MFDQPGRRCSRRRQCRSPHPRPRIVGCLNRGIMMQHRPKIPVAILGATGAVGQRFVQLLVNHPWFEIAILTGSERSIGRPYGEVTRWILDDAPPEKVARMIVQPTEQAGGVPLAFSALPADQAREM